jgi:copper oxidase (laccase) domain-containing protein
MTMPNFPDEIICSTSTVCDGNMSFKFSPDKEVLLNRQNYLKKLGLSYDQCVAMACDNGSQITVINDSNLATYQAPETQEKMLISEVLITANKNLPLMLLTADCIPAAFYDPIKKVIALAHFNRHTIAHDLATKTVVTLSEKFQSKPSDLQVSFGPYIHTESYVFDLPLDQPPSEQLADFVLKKDSQVQIDLRSAFIHQLTKAGVNKTNLTTSPSNTANSTNYFSHYRSARETDYIDGRMATILMLK